MRPEQQQSTKKTGLKRIKRGETMTGVVTVEGENKPFRPVIQSTAKRTQGGPTNSMGTHNIFPGSAADFSREQPGVQRRSSNDYTVRTHCRSNSIVLNVCCEAVGNFRSTREQDDSLDRLSINGRAPSREFFCFSQVQRSARA